MSAQRTVKMQGKKVAWGAILFGTFLIGDAMWCVARDHMWAALVVGGVGAERWIYAWTDYWHRRLWPWRVSKIAVESDGLVFEECDVYDGKTRSTLMPGGLVLDARLRRDEASNGWDIVILTILGTLVWARRHGEEEADAELEVVREVLSDVRRALTPPQVTGAIDLIPDKRGVMWGAPKLVPMSILLRCVCLLVTIVALPNIATGTASLALWGLTTITVALLAFPLVGALTALQRPTALLAFGVTMQFGELRAWERSAVTHAVALKDVDHVGFSDVDVTGHAVVTQLVAHVAEGASIDAIVPRSQLANLALQAFRSLAEMHDPDLPKWHTPSGAQWAVRLPGGLAEAIESVSFAQQFLAESKAERAALEADGVELV